MIRCDFNAEKVILEHYYASTKRVDTWTRGGLVSHFYTINLYLHYFICVRTMRTAMPCPSENQSSVHTRPCIMSIYRCAILQFRSWSWSWPNAIWLDACGSQSGGISFSLPLALLISVSIYVLHTFRKNHFGIYSDLINVVHRSSSSLHRRCHRLCVVLALDAYVCRSFTSN